jgi:hypothetical protein
MTFEITTIGLIVVVLWLIILTYFLTRIHSYNNKIFGGTKDQSTATLLQKLSAEHEDNRKEITTILKRLEAFENRAPSYFQKVGLIRFNPFKDTGGDQSFVLALTDAEHSGIVISGLYSRSGTRWYAKRIQHGKGVEHELSDEERRAIAAAK